MITSMITRAQALRPLALAPRLAVYHPQLITSETHTCYWYILYLTGANMTFPRRIQRSSNPGDTALGVCSITRTSAAWSNPPLPSQLVFHCFMLPINWVLSRHVLYVEPLEKRIRYFVSALYNQKPERPECPAYADATSPSTAIFSNTWRAMRRNQKNLQWRSAPRKITYTFVTATIDGKAHSNRKNAGKLAPISFSDVQRP